MDNLKTAMDQVDQDKETALDLYIQAQGANKTRLSCEIKEMEADIKQHERVMTAAVQELFRKKRRLFERDFMMTIASILSTNVSAPNMATSTRSHDIDKETVNALDTDLPSEDNVSKAIENAIDKELEE